MKSLEAITYEPQLSYMQTQQAINYIKTTFSQELAKVLNLTLVSAPLFVESGTGINDDLNGSESSVRFTPSNIESGLEIVHSLAKWKRMALKQYNFSAHAGLYTNMQAIRQSELLDHTHSLLVDQWDWELIIHQSDRNLSMLQTIVEKIYAILLSVEEEIQKMFPHIQKELPPKITFITTQNLLEDYPKHSPKERETAITKKYGAVFLMQIGGVLSDGNTHDGRSPDYDDWSLNGDILVYNSVFDEAFELSSMGIRVDESKLVEQLAVAQCEERLQHTYHQFIVNNELPFTIGGGIGQSRLCQFLLKKAHIGEVQVSHWPDEIVKFCELKGIPLL